MTYRRRAADTALERLLAAVPAVAVDGPKGVGKTETALQHSTVQFFLDEESQRQLVSADPQFAGVGEGTVLLDEWQRLPFVWDSVRRAVDRHAPAGRFLLTGSATPQPGNDTHSGAGRILSLRMRPMAVFERFSDGDRGVGTVLLSDLLQGGAGISGTTDVVLRDYVDAIATSGFPGITGQPADVRTQYLDAYLQRIIDRDLPDAGYSSRSPETLRRWMRAYAAASSTTTAYSALLDATTSGDGHQPSKNTTALFRDFLTRVWILDPVPAWNSLRNPFKAATQSPKHQLADPALALRLQGLSGRDLTTARGSHLTGPLFESLATLSVRAAAESMAASVSHLRTRNGDHEIDLVVEGLEGELVGVEVKLAAFVEDQDVRHLLWFREKFPEDVVDLVVLYAGTTAYRRQDGVAVIPLAMLG